MRKLLAAVVVIAAVFAAVVEGVPGVDALSRHAQGGIRRIRSRS
jgi:hypothetical protein